MVRGDLRLLCLPAHGRSQTPVRATQLRPLVERAIGGRGSGPIFLSPRGDAWSSKRLGQVFYRIRKKARLPADLVLYLTRHKHATELLRVAGVYAVKEALGHASVKTTERYLHPDDASLRDGQDAVEWELPDFDAGGDDPGDLPAAA